MKEYTKICTKYGTSLPNFPIRVGAVYGANSGRMFVCEKYEGLTDGYLIACVSRDNGKHWTVEKIDRKNKIYGAILEALKNYGLLPKVGSFKDPKACGRIVGQPKDRNPQREYSYKNNMAYSSLYKQNADNADFGGRMINASLRHDAKNSMKVMVGKNTKKPAWENVQDWQEAKDKTCHEGSRHTVGEPLTVSNMK